MVAPSIGWSGGGWVSGVITCLVMRLMSGGGSAGTTSGVIMTQHRRASPRDSGSMQQMPSSFQSVPTLLVVRWLHEEWLGTEREGPSRFRDAAVWSPRPCRSSGRT